MNFNGKIIVIEGTDGSGKETQMKALKSRFEQQGYTVYVKSFPNYESRSSEPVKMYLSGDIGENVNSVAPKAASVFFAIDRYITYKKEIEAIYEAKDQVILFDRFVTSNIIHQASKYIMEMNSKGEVAEQERLDKLTEFIYWVNNLEHNDLEIPKPDIIIYLNVPIAYTKSLMEGRNNKIDGAQKHDIHERDFAYLEASSVTGLMASKLLGWNVIECVTNNELRTIEDISQEIWQTINKQI